MSTQDDTHKNDRGGDRPLKVPMRFTEALRGLLQVKGKPEQEAPKGDAANEERRDE
jgi:hypothetical protein